MFNESVSYAVTMTITKIFPSCLPVPIHLCVYCCPRLSHVNVVRAREVPKEMSCITLNGLPMLAMEYCTKGDLRKRLNKPENYSGLKESEIVSLLNDVGNVT